MIGHRLNQSLTASGLAVGLLSSADVITPVLCSDGPLVQPVLKTWLLCAWHRLWNIVHPMHRCLAWRRRFNRWFGYLDLVFAWSTFGAQTYTDARASELPTTIGCTDATCIGSSGAPVFCRTHPIQRFFEFFLRVLLCMTFLFYPWDIEMFT